MREGNIPLEKVIQLGQVAEQTKVHAKQLRDEEKLVNQITEQ